MQDGASANSIMMPSGARVIIEDRDLQKYFQSLFGSTEAGAALIVNAAGKNRRDNDADIKRNVHARPIVKNQRTG